MLIIAKKRILFHKVGIIIGNKIAGFTHKRVSAIPDKY